MLNMRPELGPAKVEHVAKDPEQGHVGRDIHCGGFAVDSQRIGHGVPEIGQETGRQRKLRLCCLGWTGRLG